MTHLDAEIQLLKRDTGQMFDLVITQLTKSREALIRFDKDLAMDVDINEKRVNAFELRIDTKCEKILALFNPVAVDLRFVLAVLKINYNLERIGDYARGIALIVKDAAKPFDTALLEKTKILEMFGFAFEILHDTQNAFINEIPKLARNAFQKDKLLDDINNNANNIVSNLIIGKTEKQIINILGILTVMRKLERVGDQTKNIAEEVIFYIEAKVIKHKANKSIVENELHVS